MSGNVIRAGFIGNPNCGKTTLFNACTGANLKVANWPGVTVEKKEGWTNCHGRNFWLTDLPGVYSLDCYTMEEKVSREFILGTEVDVIVDVVDASSLERNLYLTLQLIELDKPVVLALNMMDIVKKKGMEINLCRLAELLGIPCVGISARERTGIELLLDVVAWYEEYEKMRLPPGGNYDVIENVISQTVKKKQESDEDILQKNWNKTDGKNDRTSNKADITDRIDQYLTGKWLGLPIFLVIMALVFFLTFTIGGWMKGYFEAALELYSERTKILLQAWKVSSLLQSLIVEGILSGVGGVLTFLPNIFILFLALAVLEDSGYMARAAFVMDDMMGKLGFSGKAFLPLLLGFGCSVPAIMASRTLEHRGDRLKTILITPFMSCSARLPVYVLFSSMFFGKYAMAVCYSMYLLGILVAIVTAWILAKLDGSRAEHTLLIELPEYRAPDAKTIAVYVWEKVKDYLSKAGTVIFLASILMWLLLNFGTDGYVTNMTQSFGAVIGKKLVPLFEPAGLGFWQIIVALISGIAAKEVVVSSCSVLFGIQNITTADGMAGFAHILEEMGFGMANAYAMMTFCLLYVPCMAAIATIRREVGSRKLTAAIILYQTAAAWGMSVLIYQVMHVLTS